MKLHLPPCSTPAKHLYLHRLIPRSVWCIMNHMKHSEWIERLTGAESTRSIGAKIGVSHTTISRQITAEKLSSEVVIALCRAYNHPAVEGLVETGYLYPHEVETPGVNLVLPKATNRQLLEEINRRSDPEARRLFTATDDADVVDVDEATVFDFPQRNVPARWDGVPDEAAAYGHDLMGGTPDDFEQ